MAAATAGGQRARGRARPGRQGARSRGRFLPSVRPSVGHRPERAEPGLRGGTAEGCERQASAPASATGLPHRPPAPSPQPPGLPPPPQLLPLAPPRLVPPPAPNPQVYPPSPQKQAAGPSWCPPHWGHPLTPPIATHSVPTPDTSAALCPPSPLLPIPRFPPLLALSHRRWPRCSFIPVQNERRPRTVRSGRQSGGGAPLPPMAPGPKNLSKKHGTAQPWRDGGARGAALAPAWSPPPKKQSSGGPVRPHRHEAGMQRSV